MTHVRKAILLRIAAAAVLAAASVGFAQSAPLSPAKTASVQDAPTQDPLAQGFLVPSGSAKSRT